MVMVLPKYQHDLTELLPDDPNAWIGNYLRGGKMIELRRTSEKKPGVFPFGEIKVPILLIGERTILIANGLADKIRLIELAEKNPCILLAAWPGRMSQDIFLLDNRQYALSVLRKLLLRAPSRRQRRKK